MLNGSGLAYSDDIVLLCENLTDLRKCLAELGDWTSFNMYVNRSKT